MTLDVEYNEPEQSTFYVVGGLANKGEASDESFLYSFLDGSNECGLRHSYRITSLNLGIQGVSISTNVIWAIGFAQG